MATAKGIRIPWRVFKLIPLHATERYCASSKWYHFYFILYKNNIICEEINLNTVQGVLSPLALTIFEHRPQRGWAPLISLHMDVHSKRPSVRPSVCPYIHTLPPCCPTDRMNVHMWWDERASAPLRPMPHFNPLITLSTEMGHREPMNINAFESSYILVWQDF
jgi:hypothetical protein